MMYLANPCSPAVREAMGDGVLGLIDTPLQRNTTATTQLHESGAAWCADNGCFSDRWQQDRWWRFLQEGATHAATCLFAAAPDVVGDAQATLDKSLPWLPRIRELGYPAALVAQDGLESLTVPWDDLDALFIGGSTEWKLGPHARALVAEAKARGKWVHMGRVNSARRFNYARAIGCDSVDGTFLTFGPDRRLPELLGWLERAESQPNLPIGV